MELFTGKVVWNYLNPLIKGSPLKVVKLPPYAQPLHMIMEIKAAVHKIRKDACHGQQQLMPTNHLAQEIVSPTKTKKKN